jgi:hypothetical protein
MPDGPDNIRLNEQLDKLQNLVQENTRTTERVLWIISDHDTGLVKRVGDIGQVLSMTVKEQTELTLQATTLAEKLGEIQERQVKAMALQDKHDDAINELVKCAADAKEARKPWLAVGFGLMEKLLWVIALGLIGWLGYLVALKK